MTETETFFVAMFAATCVLVLVNLLVADCFGRRGLMISSACAMVAGLMLAGMTQYFPESVGLRAVAATLIGSSVLVFTGFGADSLLPRDKGDQ